MPNGKLSDKYKGKPFGEIAKEIQGKYQDRYDPISKRGLMSEMSALKEQQEFQKAKIEAREQLTQALAQAQNPQQMQPQQGMQAPMQMQQPMQASNQGVAPQMLPEEVQGHPASESYNQQFGMGGTMDYAGGGLFNIIDNDIASTGLQSALAAAPRIASSKQDENNYKMALSQQRLDKLTAGNSVFGNGKNQLVDYKGGVNPTGFMNAESNQIPSEKINPLRYAPLASNLFNILSARKPGSTLSEMSKMGYKTSIDESLGSQVVPRQTQFNNVDVSQLERGINTQARGFTGANLNASGGNAGQFLANELGNQSNIMNAIANARMQSQQQDRQTTAMNAGEQGRIDNFLQGQAGQRQQIQGANIGIGMQLADLDARNLGAFNNYRSQNIAGLTTNLGSIGKEEDQMRMIANALGYSSFGEFVQGMSPEERAKFLPSFMGSIGSMFNKG